MATLTARFLASCTSTGTDTKAVTYNGSVWNSGDRYDDVGGTTAFLDDLTQAITSSASSGDTGTYQDDDDGSVATFTVDAMPSDFDTMTTLSVNCSTDWRGSLGDDTRGLGVLITNAAGTTTLAGFSTSTTVYQALHLKSGTSWTPTSTTFGVQMSGGPGTAPAYNETIGFTYVNTTATKSDWDGAVARLYWGENPNMGSDTGVGIVLVDITFVGTYTPTAPASRWNPRIFTPQRDRRGASNNMNFY